LPKTSACAVVNTGTGILTINWDTNDQGYVVSSNTEDVNSLTFTSYGYFKAETWIEDSGVALNNVNMNFGGTDYNLSNSLTINLSTFPLTSTQYTATFTIEGYGTRYYTADFNRFSVIDLNFLMLPNDEGRNIEFQVFAADETTKYSNTYVEMFNHNVNNWVAGRRKTDADGFVTFFLNPNDENYTMKIYSTTTVDYNAMTLTVNKPKDELTGLTIDGNWSMEVTGLAWQDYAKT